MSTMETNTLVENEHGSIASYFDLSFTCPLRRSAL